MADGFMDEVREMRKKLSREVDPPIQEAIDAGVVLQYVRYLSEVTWPELQLEAGWALTNIASGSSAQTRIVVQAGAVPRFIEQLSSPNTDVQGQALWALANIAGDSTDLRDDVLRGGCLLKILAIGEKEPGVLFDDNAGWALRNLVAGTPLPPLELVEPLVAGLRQLLATGVPEHLADLCWAASSLSDGGDCWSGALLRIVALLRHEAALVQIPALRAIGNMVSGSNEHAQAALDAGFLQAVPALLRHDKMAIRKGTCWALLNVLAGNPGQVQAVIDCGLVRGLLLILQGGGEALPGAERVREEACFALGNPFTVEGKKGLNMRFLSLDLLAEAGL